jgi:hypothetical protein
MSTRDRVWPATIVGLAAVSMILVLTDWSGPVRAPLVLAFAAVCPGMALVRLVRVEEAVPELLLAVVVSLALAAVVPAITFYVGMWSAKLSLLLITEVTAVLGTYCDA